jgi:hypothetical protein
VTVRIQILSSVVVVGLCALPAANILAAPPNIVVAGSCDGAGNSIFTITNTGGDMTTNYTWNIYQNSIFLTSGPFSLTAGQSMQLTINGLYGNVMVTIKNGTTPAAVEIASATAFCVTPTPTVTRTPTRTPVPPNIVVTGVV